MVELLSGESRPAQICRRYNIMVKRALPLEKAYLGGRLNLLKMKLTRSSFYHKSRDNPEKMEKKADLRGKIEVS
ncbi:hypothetical protein M1N59_00370 [Dehalococcoidales bacterium]|nr:hypothetical protein [Dehalococcoidales bacterium]